MNFATIKTTDGASHIIAYRAVRGRLHASNCILFLDNKTERDFATKVAIRGCNTIAYQHGSDCHKFWHIVFTDSTGNAYDATLDFTMRYREEYLRWLKTISIKEQSKWEDEESAKAVAQAIDKMDIDTEEAMFAILMRGTEDCYSQESEYGDDDYDYSSLRRDA